MNYNRIERKVESRQTKIAYMLLVHNNPKQLNIFLQQILDSDDGDIYLHVDKKNIQMIGHLLKNDRITIISEYEVKWASFEMVAATISLMKIVINSKKKYSHVYYGSGNDLLVKRGLKEFLERNDQYLYMKIFGEILPDNPLAARYRIKWPEYVKVRSNWHPCRIIRMFFHLFFKAGIVLNPNKEKVKFEHIFRGSQWFIIPIGAVEYILYYLEKNPDYIKFWECALAPDEFFFHTIILNSKYGKLIRPSLMYLTSSTKVTKRNHPLTITMNDIGLIDKSECYCARKFDMQIDPDVISYYIGKTKWVN